MPLKLLANHSRKNWHRTNNFVFNDYGVGVYKGATNLEFFIMPQEFHIRGFINYFFKLIWQPCADLRIEIYFYDYTAHNDVWIWDIFTPRVTHQTLYTMA